ncbi:hypothetical protein F5X97DRAFT_308535 [Nemania serpens]|nr:hypothetical protein F5X97DRAFT_308535 [Nemania serpens]
MVKSSLTTLTTIGDVPGSAIKKAGPVLADVATKSQALQSTTEPGSFGQPGGLSGSLPGGRYRPTRNKRQEEDRYESDGLVAQSDAVYGQAC